MNAGPRIHVIACGVLAMDLRAAAKRTRTAVTTQFLPGGLHDQPRALRSRLQEAIDAVTAEQVDRIVVGYGVCGLGSVGIHARDVPLAIPRVNDCIALFLGSDAAYREQFARCPGTYYVAAGWVEEKGSPQEHGARRRVHCGERTLEFDELVTRFGEENAEVIRQFLSSWQQHYQRAAFIDTGVGGNRQRYARMAEAMARELGWRYEALPGSGELLDRLLTADTTDNDVLIVPPSHVTAYDPLRKGLKAVPVHTGERDPAQRVWSFAVDDTGVPTDDATETNARIGLGIDAGGTYTDTVLFDLSERTVLDKAKALTTRWDFTVGIREALDSLDATILSQVERVAVSTTLATNAIVEDQGQKVGLLIMPPYGRLDPGEINHEPCVVLDGQLEIDGRELAPIQPEQVRAVARQLVDQQQVTAFAVTGYASHANPAHELLVKQIVRETTGLSVTCGHEISDRLNYRVRATTTALNARIIPCLERLLEQVAEVLDQRGITAGIMVVKSDGSLMSVRNAREKPIETILSGPAASVAGAGFLARQDNAIVVDMGGTTTDTAMIRDGVVRTGADGAVVGRWHTHVEALQMRTMGLGGDSLIAWDQRRLRIGPRRVAPIAWLAARTPDVTAALDWIDRHRDHFTRSSQAMELVALNGRDHDNIALGPRERRILDALAEGPASVHELAHRVTGSVFEHVPLARLEANHLVQRCGLTPTDVLHSVGQVSLWDTQAAHRLTALFAELLGTDPQAFAEDVIDRVCRQLAAEILTMQIAPDADAQAVNETSLTQTLIANWLDGGEADYCVRIKLHHPVIGVGAPVHLFLPAAARALETEAIIPPDADVANAIGAIVSMVTVHKRVEIAPDEAGGFQIRGLPGAPAFKDLDDAYEYAVSQLQEVVRAQGRQAGTSESRVQFAVEDRVSPLADGGELFMGRIIEARLAGSPDRVQTPV